MTSKHATDRFPYRTLTVAASLICVAAILNIIAASVALFGL